MVSGETWAEYGLGPSGQVEAKTLRGPLIVWATKPGEGEDLPRLEAPTPSPLEVEAARLNMRPHFLAFVRAARCRVGSKFWRYGRRHRYAVKEHTMCILRQARRIIDAPGRCSRMRRRGYAKRSNYNAIWRNIRKNERLTLTARIGSRFSFQFLIICMFANPNNGTLNAVNARRAMFGAAITLRAIQRAAYRAHVARRVRPPARRSRIPRPIYARPRPPTAPLAPPVTC